MRAAAPRRQIANLGTRNEHCRTGDLVAGPPPSWRGSCSAGPPAPETTTGSAALTTGADTPTRSSRQIRSFPVIFTVAGDGGRFDGGRTSSARLSLPTVNGKCGSTDACRADRLKPRWLLDAVSTSENAAGRLPAPAMGCSTHRPVCAAGLEKPTLAVQRSPLGRATGDVGAACPYPGSRIQGRGRIRSSRAKIRALPYGASGCGSPVRAASARTTSWSSAWT
jgi:hypothetical protein